MELVLLSSVLCFIIGFCLGINKGKDLRTSEVQDMIEELNKE